jgi:hypothetical protein
MNTKRRLFVVCGNQLDGMGKLFVKPGLKSGLKFGVSHRVPQFLVFPHKDQSDFTRLGVIEPYFF